jgi:signal transduction histidine kinase
MGVVLLGISLVLAGLTFGVVRRNMRPLADVLAATTQLAMGDLAIRCPPGGRDEIAEVADSFNAMAEALQARDQRVTRAHRAIEEARSELEERVASRTGALEHTNGELLRALTSLRETQAELLHSQKLASVGQLAAGIAHEINTPTQFIADNVEFLRTGVRDLLTLLTAYRSIIVQSAGSTTAPGVLAQLEETEKDLDLAFLRSEVPGAIDQALEGTGRIAEIVKAMKQFAHPEQGELTHTDLNECIRSTVTVARSEWKYVAELELDLDPTLPLVPCLPGEFNQVMLNLVVNAAQAIGDAGGTKSGHKGHIRINSHVRDDQVEISVDDTGTGIPAEIQGRIFEPFFTTKEVGRGTGQGLAIAHSVIVHKLRGSLTFKTEVGRGTTFLIRLPLTGLVEAGEPPAAVA